MYIMFTIIIKALYKVNILHYLCKQVMFIFCGEENKCVEKEKKLRCEKESKFSRVYEKILAVICTVGIANYLFNCIQICSNDLHSDCI